MLMENDKEKLETQDSQKSRGAPSKLGVIEEEESIKIKNDEGEKKTPDSPSKLNVIEEEESAEIQYEEDSEDPHSVFGPSYPPIAFVPEKNKVENPIFDPNYGKSHGYNSIDANGIQKIKASRTVSFECTEEETLETKNFQKSSNSPSKLSVIEEEESAEIEYEDVPEDPHFVFGPCYPPSTFVPEKNKVENPRYDPDYGKSHGYNYIDANGIQIAMNVGFRDLDLPYAPPPFPTSKIPHSRNKSALGRIILFMRHYWYYFLIGIVAAVIMSTVITVISLKSNISHQQVISTTAHPPANATCPSGFTQIGFKCWMLFKEEITSEKAEKSCKEKGFHLVTVKNTEENIRLESIVGSSMVWIGLQCKSTDAQQCQWDDGTMLHGYNNFQSGNPTAVADCTYYDPTAIAECTYYDQFSNLWNSDCCDVYTRSSIDSNNNGDQDISNY